MEPLSVTQRTPRRVSERGQGTYDVVVIGGGTAGLVTAAATAGLGGRAALVERHLMGGDCLNTGCVPSKALIASARLARSIRRGSRWGLQDAEPSFRFEDVMDRVRERIARIAPHDSAERFESLGVHVFRGQARFVSPHEVDVDGQRLRGRSIVIAAGSRAGLPPVEGLAESEPYTNETIFGLTTRPARMIVIGGGPIGCELGQAFQNLGVEVTLLEAQPRLLDKEDEDAATVVHGSLRDDGVRVRTGIRIGRVSRTGATWRAEVATDGAVETLEAEALLVAAGRVPNTGGLELEAAGVAYTKRGITVNAHLQTSQPHIYAAGDIAGSYQFTHLADHHARVVVRNILFPWWKVKVDTSVLPWCTYTTPELARVGLSEAEAGGAGVAVDVWRHGLDGLDRAIVESREDGFAKVLTARGSDRIVGATVVGEHAGEVVHELAVAMKAGLGLKGLASTIHAYPTWAEAAKRVADAYQRSRLTPRAKSIMARLYRWQRA